MIQQLNDALEGRYRVEREVGEGGMATVYVAEDVRHGRRVAVKVLRPELTAVVGAERFLAEIRTTAALQHPHILPLHDSGDAIGILYYVMPFDEGETLRDRLDRVGQLPVDEAVQIAGKVAAALEYAHEQGVLHRDIKPANILLSRGEPLVADFGIAVHMRRNGPLTSRNGSKAHERDISPRGAAPHVGVPIATVVGPLRSSEQIISPPSAIATDSARSAGSRGRLDHRARRAARPPRSAATSEGPRPR